MARINLSIPDELKQLMDDFPDVNWSEVAREAFQAAVTINQLRGTDMQASGIERLRVSKRTNEARERAEGEEFGKKYALEEAEYDELKTYASLAAAQEPADDMRKGLAGGEYDPFGNENPSDAYIEGFLTGCATVFQRV